MKIVHFLFFLIFLVTTNGCKKTKPIDKGCGCNTATIVQTVTDINAALAYVNNQGYEGWYLFFPAGSNFNNQCKICNLNLPKLKAITDTMSHSNTINVKFSGKAKDLCDGESFGFNNGFLFYYYMTLDDIIKQ